MISVFGISIKRLAYCVAVNEMRKSIYTSAYRHMLSLLVQSRESSEITQASLATSLGKPQSFVSKYESGERRLDVVELIEIAEMIGIDACQIINEIKRIS